MKNDMRAGTLTRQWVWRWMTKPKAKKGQNYVSMFVAESHFLWNLLAPDSVSQEDFECLTEEQSVTSEMEQAAMTDEERLATLNDICLGKSAMLRFRKGKELKRDFRSKIHWSFLAANENGTQSSLQKERKREGSLLEAQKRSVMLMNSVMLHIKDSFDLRGAWMQKCVDLLGRVSYHSSCVA